MTLASYITTFMSSRTSPAATATTSSTTTTTTAAAITASTVTTTIRESTLDDSVSGSDLVRHQETQQNEKLIQESSMEMVVDENSPSVSHQGSGAEGSSNSNRGAKASNTDVNLEHFRVVLGNTAPVGTVVSEDTLNNLVNICHAIVQQSSEAAALKALSSGRSLTTSKGPRAKATPRKTTNVIKGSNAKGELRGTRTPLKIQKPATKGTGRGKAVVATSSKAKAKAHQTSSSTRNTRSAGSAEVQKPVKAEGKGRASAKKTAQAADEAEEAIEDEEMVDESDELEDEDEEMVEEYEVQSILGHRVMPGEDIKFKIWWKGYPRNQSTWEDDSALDGCQDLLKEYVEKHNLKL
ncbi:hypothetical protein BGX31_003688 [Mortierella sp. GBA43]|nr:hypothetical protein BGX31_003688 [Mortierella sp. GBA43]